MREGRQRCFDCTHFYVTWDAAFPRGCRAMGFKGRELPEDVVRSASGRDCACFERKRVPGRRGGRTRRRGF